VNTLRCYPMANQIQWVSARLPGVLLCALIAAASTLISQSYGGPLFLYALLLGMAFNSILAGSKLATGITFTTKTLLRLGVALMGLRLSLDMVETLGAAPFITVIGGISLTIAFGMLLAKWLGRTKDEGILACGAVSICGASAAMAISAALPNHPEKERMTLFTVVGVTALSTVAMVLYPMLANALQLSSAESAMLFGGTIHDVAQVVGAALVHGGEGSAEMASYVKLLRVAMLAPVVLGVGIFITSRASQADQAGAKSTLIPLFLVGFFALFALVNFVTVPTEIIAAGSTASRTLILLAVAGLGVKTSLKELASLGWRPMLMLVANTLFLLLVVLLLIWFERGLFAV
jgi:uncharacterized integral membrane protein (TIGR00698 family)